MMDVKTGQLIIEELGRLTGQELIRRALERFGAKVSLASSFSAEDQIILDMLCRISTSAKVFTLDTGRLPMETYRIIEDTRVKYGIEIEMLFPDEERLSEMVTIRGPNLFYESVENRKLCCQIRKVEPLKKKLATLDAWICGLRSEQAVTRMDVHLVEWDESHGLVKINPLADWTTEQVWEYIRRNDVPYNKLHDMGYPSIGCAPCTRAVEAGEDIRAGRWWWEEPEHKECGLHLKQLGIKN